MIEKQPEALLIADDLETYYRHIVEALRAQIGQDVPDVKEIRRVLECVKSSVDAGIKVTDGWRILESLLASAPPAPQQKPLLASEIWNSDAIMEVNADARLPFEMIERFVRAIEAAHNIGEKK